MFEKKLKLANTPTPLEIAKFEGQSFLIKRDDYTGTELTGNKIRKLEYLLIEAKKEKADIIITCGAVQSNHARATVIAAAKAGMSTRLFLWGKKSTAADGNIFLSRYFGAKIKYLDKREYASVNELMAKERKRLEEKGRKAYVIPEGGSTTFGIAGYASFIEELKGQLEGLSAEGIISAAGTGGTAAGLLLGNAVFSSEFKIYAVNVLHNAEEIRKKIITLAEAAVLEHKLDVQINPDQLIILDGYSKEGYKKISSDKLKLIKRFALHTGILLDPAYTGKAFAAYYDNFLLKGTGMKNIFLHTGGIFGSFSKREQYLQI